MSCRVGRVRNWMRITKKRNYLNNNLSMVNFEIYVICEILFVMILNITVAKYLVHVFSIVITAAIRKCVLQNK